MKKSLICLFILILFLFPIVNAAVINVASCSYSDVSAAINSAQNGDTILVPAGTCVWDKQLIINKPLNIIGAGMDKTIIKSGYIAPNTFSTYSSTCLIYYNPGEPTPDHVFQLTGFTFDCNGTCGFLFVKTSGVPFARNFRVNGNLIKNTNPEGVAGWRAIYVWAHVSGVIDNNIFTGCGSIMGGYGRNTVSWTNHTFSFGSADQLYFEDNTVETKGTPHSGGGGGRYCARYNNYTKIGTGGLYPWYDAHGNQPGGHPAHMGLEIYSNTLIMANGYSGVGIFDQRGGMGLVYNNNVISTGSVSAKAREEFNDATHTPYEGPEGQPMHVSDSYYWGNTKNGVTLVNPYIGSEFRWDIVNYSDATWDYYYGPLAYKGVVPRWDVHAWRQVSDFNGSSGVGVGPLANRPVSCTLEGAGWWATDEEKLYRWKNGAWELYYTPYIYPHPLRVASFGTDICDEGEITTECWCEGLKSVGYCYHGYYFSEEGERIIIPLVDTTPPVRTSGYPTGNLSSGTTSTTIGLITNEVAICKYSLTQGISYGSMTNTFSTTDSTSHSKLITGLTNGNTYSYYVKCSDLSGNSNTDDYLITFSVSEPLVDQEPYCGDRKCDVEIGENCKTCRQDCGDCRWWKKFFDRFTDVWKKTGKLIWEKTGKVIFGG